MSTADVEIRVEDVEDLEAYAEISIAFTTDRVLMVEALTDDELIREAPAIVSRASESGRTHTETTS